MTDTFNTLRHDTVSRLRHASGDPFENPISAEAATENAIGVLQAQAREINALKSRLRVRAAEPDASGPLELLPAFFARVRTEVERQDIAYAHCAPPSTPCARLAVLVEEIGKVAHAALCGDPADTIPEACGVSMARPMEVLAAATFRMWRSLPTAG